MNEQPDFNFKEATYYAVREDYNNSIKPGYLDEKHDNLIRKAIAYVETHGFPCGATQVEVASLARAARRRIELDKKSPERFAAQGK